MTDEEIKKTIKAAEKAMKTFRAETQKLLDEGFKVVANADSTLYVYKEETIKVKEYGSMGGADATDKKG